MRLLVCGGRDFEDVDFMVHHLLRIHNEQPVTTLISGRAPGADTIAEYWAEEMGIPIDPYPAKWHIHGRSAGPKRNQQMLDEGKPEFVMAFPGGKGTAHMVKISHAAKVQVWQSKWLYIHKDKRGDFLSNFAEGFEFVDQEDGLIWGTSEHYYQSRKTMDEVERGHIQLSPTPREAQKRGRAALIYQNWNELKEDYMREALQKKFHEGSKAADMLLDTNSDYIVEYAPWGDTYWGVDTTYNGKNRLGVLLMERREELIESYY